MADSAGSNFYFFLCLFLRKRFLRLCVAILCLFLFLPLGIIKILLGDLFLLHRVHKYLCGLESRDVVSRNGDGGMFGDIACGLLCAALDDEAAETTEINGLTGDEGTLDDLCKFLNNVKYLYFFNTGCFCNFTYDVCFSHNTIIF